MKKTVSAIGTICLMLLLGQQTPVLRAAGLPPLAPDPFVSRAAEQENLAYADLAELSLRASGVQDGEIDGYRRQLEKLLASFKERHAEELDDAYRTGKNLLDFLHSTTFMSYERQQTKIDVLLETGRHNCVSSGVVYMIMAAALNLQPSGIIVPDHAFVAITTARGLVDVETTSRYGFDPGSSQPFFDAFDRITGFSYVPPGNYTQREETGLKRFIGLIYQNRIAALQRSGDREAPVALAIDRYALDSASREELIGILRNRALVFGERGHYRKGLDWVLQAAARYDLTEGFSEIITTFAHNLILSQIRSGEYEQALDNLREYSPSLSEEDRGGLASLLFTGKLEQGLEQHAFGQLLEEVAKARKDGVLPPENAAKTLLSLYSQRVGKLIEEGEFKQALLLLRQADDSLKEREPFQQLLRTARENTITSFHNAMVPLYNSGRYEEALETVEEGLELLPDSETLSEDRRLIRVRMGQE